MPKYFAALTILLMLGMVLTMAVPPSSITGRGLFEEALWQGIFRV
jgi:hypothetical protein